MCAQVTQHKEEEKTITGAYDLNRLDSPTVSLLCARMAALHVRRVSTALRIVTEDAFTDDHILSTH
eukprot:6202305-Pleurochrysis_carterae.AAC.2